MLICELPWSFDWTKLNEPQKTAILAHWPCAKKQYNEKEDKLEAYNLRRQRLMLEEVYEIQRTGVELDIEGVDGTMLTKMRDRGSHTGLTSVDMQDHKVVQIAVSDVGLLVMNEVQVCEDCCTDYLQQQLDEGWRILAVCPPNAARRPDYVLGRRKA